MNNFQNIKIEKSMYNIAGKSFSEILESLDPSSSYQESQLKNLDAYQRQLKRFDIKVSGPKCDTIEKFFISSDSAPLFPEYVLRAVKSGIYSESILKNIIATKTTVDSLDYRTISCNPSKNSRELKSVAEGAIIPSTTINLKSNLIKLYKTGRLL